MQKSNKGINIRLILSIVTVCVIIPIVLFLSSYMGARRYYLTSMIIIVLALIPFFIGLENKRPGAREIVTIAVLSAIAVASRVAFIMIPQFKPIVGVIIISGISFGALPGFVVGAVSALVSNFLFGQGPWTPWQMFAFGIAGFLGGILGKVGVIGSQKRISTAIIGALIIMLITGPILDTSSLFIMIDNISVESAIAVYTAGLPLNAVHALAVFITLFFLTKPMCEKLDRIKLKYGILKEKSDEI